MGEEPADTGAAGGGGEERGLASTVRVEIMLVDFVELRSEHGVEAAGGGGGEGVVVERGFIVEVLEPGVLAACSDDVSAPWVVGGVDVLEGEEVEDDPSGLTML